MATKFYPVGIQTFSEIITKNYLYVDKTEYIYRMTHYGKKYLFLSRPRRFGKSLLASTLQSYFEGKKELFKGLAIEKLEKDWTEYPVLHFSMAGGKHMEPDALQRYLLFILKQNEKQFGIEADDPDPNVRLLNLINIAHEQTGKNVVILIDEYDAPLLDVVHEETQLNILRDIMRNFYSPLKDSDPKLHFVFLTGITKFSQLSIFSELNNITNISMLPEYAGICGITKEELLTQMKDYVQELCDAKNWTMEQTVAKLKEYYDGYHFAGQSPDIFNPFSLLSCLSLKRVDPYWFASGTPTYLINMMKKFDVDFTDFAEGMEAGASDFDAPTETMTTLTPPVVSKRLHHHQGFGRGLRLLFPGHPKQGGAPRADQGIDTLLCYAEHADYQQYDSQHGSCARQGGLGPCPTASPDLPWHHSLLCQH